jgi:hypothetical protein
MSLRASMFAFLAAGLALAPASAGAQETRLDRFQAEKVAEGESVFQGRLTSSTFFFQEIGDSIVNGGNELADNASPAARLYTELRAQLGWTQPGVNRVDVRADARVRVALPCEYAFQTDPAAGLQPGQIGYDDCRTQSGTYGGNEYDIRELYGRRAGAELELQAGRQYVGEIAATKVDGVKATYVLDGNWSLIGFGGLAPSRISRSVIDDYQDGVLPIAAGAGGAYRYQRYFGSVGAAGIVPLVTSNADAEVQPRIFVTSNGYWRPSDMVDVYHYLAVDLAGASTDEVSDRFTNVTLGTNVKPVEDLRVTATLQHFSTDTLDEFARLRLDDAAQNDIVQNNVDVLRVSSQAARLGVSLALMEKRFEVSTSFQVRHRPTQAVCSGNSAEECSMADVGTTEDAWSGEAMLSLVDRQSIGGLRLGASLINMFGLYKLGLGNDSYGRSNYLVARLNASRPLMGQQAHLDADLAYLHAEDVGRNNCDPASPLTCYGSAVTDTVSGGATLYYRFQPDWFVLATVNAALQMFDAPSVTDRTADPIVAASNTALTGFLRLAYRF